MSGCQKAQNSKPLFFRVEPNSTFRPLYYPYTPATPLPTLEPTPSPTPAPVFATYELTEDELRGLAALCCQEQGTPKGAAAEASLMANRFELYSSSEKTATALFDYVCNSGWFQKPYTHMQDRYNVDEEVLDAVYLVLMKGMRTMPLYVDEHDCLPDIVNVSINNELVDATELTNYIKDVTVITNEYGSNYVFYDFADTNQDPFGYTNVALKEQYKDNCYNFEQDLLPLITNKNAYTR